MLQDSKDCEIEVCEIRGHNIDGTMGLNFDEITFLVDTQIYGNYGASVFKASTNGQILSLTLKINVKNICNFVSLTVPCRHSNIRQK